MVIVFVPRPGVVFHPFQMAGENALEKGVLPTTYKSWDDPPSKGDVARWRCTMPGHG